LTSDLLAELPASIRPHKAGSSRGPMTRAAPTRPLITLGSWVLFAAVALAPLPFGSNLPTAIAFWCIVLGAAIVFASPAVNALRSGQIVLPALAFVVVAAYALVLYEQLAEHPIIPAQPNTVWREAEAALGVPLAPAVAIAHGQPWLELGRPLICVLALPGRPIAALQP
jgi:hypothetical protein